MRLKYRRKYKIVITYDPKRFWTVQYRAEVYLRKTGELVYTTDWKHTEWSVINDIKREIARKEAVAENSPVKRYTA